jgi:hypothetical protein
MRAGGLEGEILPWRDVLHEGPVPADLSLAELSDVRARWLADQGLSEPDELLRDFMERDNILRRYCDFDEVVLWFEWDLYDQLQLIQILDFFASASANDRAETGTRLSIVNFEGYLGNLDPERFAGLFDARNEITESMLGHARGAWRAFRSSNPTELNKIMRLDDAELPFLSLAVARELEEFPSTLNGLSRSESQILEAVSQQALSFHEIFQACANREERIFCGDTVLAMYIERMSRDDNALIRYTSGELIDAPRTDQDSRAFRNAEMALTKTGRAVLAGEKDWISLGGSDRWLGGVHLEGANAKWRWNPDIREVVAA